MATLTATKQTDNRQAFTNCGFTDPKSFKELLQRAPESAKVPDGSAIRCEVKHFVLNVQPDSKHNPGELGVSHVHRTCFRIALDEQIAVVPWSFQRPLESIQAVTIHLGLTPVSRNPVPVHLKDTQMEAWCRSKWVNQVLTMNQLAFVEAVDTRNGSSTTLFGSIMKIEGIDFGVKDGNEACLLQGLVTKDTEFIVEPQSATIEVSRSKSQQRNLFKTDFNFEQLGIGGLDKEFADIFRRAFASRIYPPHVVQQLGITHVRGMLLHGPPGTGKTLIARQIGKALRAKEPKIVNGPEVLNKFVGQSEENIRKLFAEAEADQKKMGDNSPLHIIIFDELDAICKQRGSNPSSAGVNDSIVNQLLSKIDGVDALNNILLIGMTNRIDMLDEALLRPGRLEVHIEIGLPDEFGRLQILRIHTKSMRDSNRLAPDISLEELSKVTKNFSGAELAGLIRSAVSYSFARNVDMNDLTNPQDEENVVVCRQDFQNALQEVKPAFGVSEDLLDQYILNGMILFSNAASKLQMDLVTLTNQVRDIPSSPLISLLLWGSSGSGKTAIACHVAKNSGFPFVKVVTPNDYIGFTELARCAAITKCFEDAYKSELSVVILDDLERLMDYTALGPRFSNLMLQTLMVLVKRVPTKSGRRILIIGTTSEPAFIQESGLLGAFQLAYHCPMIESADSLFAVMKGREMSAEELRAMATVLFPRESAPTKIGVKTLFLAFEMASELKKPDSPDARTLITCLKDYGVVVKQ